MNNNLEKFDIEETESIKPKKKSNKVLIIIVVVLLLAMVLFYLFTQTDIFIKNSPTPIETPKVVFEIKDVVYDFGAKLNEDIKKYVKTTDIDYDEVTIYFGSISVDENGRFDEVGEYEYKVYYRDQEYTAKISVVDNVAPVVITKTAYIPLGGSIDNPDIFLRKVTDNSGSYVSEIIDKEKINLSFIGEHKVKISVKDLSENETVVNSKLVILGSEYSQVFPNQDLNVSYNDKEDNEWDGTFTEKFLSGISDSSLLYKNAELKIKNYDWKKSVLSKYPKAKIISEDVIVLYNQHDLIIGITKRIRLEIDKQTKQYYFNY